MSLNAESEHEIGIFSLFSVQIILTTKGLENTDNVIAAVFKFAQTLRDFGPLKFVFDEL